MRELRNCDFCTADAAGAFEVVPDELEPTDAEQRRVVLCPDCKDRLEVLLEPLLARAGVEGAAANASDEAASTGSCERGWTQKPTNDSPSGAADEITFEDGASEADSGEKTVDGGDTAGGEPRDAGADSSSDDPAAVDDSSSDTPAIGDDSTDESTVGDDSADEASVDDPAAGDRPTATADGRSTDSTAENRSTDSAAEKRSADSAADGRSTDGDASDESKTATRSQQSYRKVVRLLRNREFPMDRTAVESLAAGAYDLENHEVEAIVDQAIERGEFVEDGGKLRRANSND